jgi:(2Fe-2S) ferredoxin
VGDCDISHVLPAEYLIGYLKMPKPKFITDREQLEKLAPMLKAPIKRHVFVCTGKSCSAVGAQEVMAEFSRILTEKGLRNGKESKGRDPMGEIVLTECGSIGFCSIGTAVMVYPDGTIYGQVQPEDAAEIVEEHLVEGKIVERLALMELGQNRER